MKYNLISVLLAIFASDIFAFQCEQDYSLEKAYENAERGFLIYVIETRLEEKLYDELLKKQFISDDGNEAVKVISAGYRVIEEFKGNAHYRPKLFDLLGVGTGFVGLIPGQYYLVLLPKMNDDEITGGRRVDICTAPLSHYRLNVPEFQEQLNIIREIRDK